MNEKIQQILTDLERVQENLLALSNEIWLNIDRKDSQALQKGFEFQLAFNEKLDGFKQITCDISELVQNFTDIPVEPISIASKGSPEHKHIIQVPDSAQIHNIEEDFTYKYPYGFVFEGQAYKGVNTWKRLYELFCQQLAANDLNRFKKLVESPDAKTVRGTVVFANNPTNLIRPLEVASGIYAEGNLSANAIRDRIQFLLSLFRIDSQQLSIYLREDCDVAQNKD